MVNQIAGGGGLNRRRTVRAPLFMKNPYQAPPPTPTVSRSAPRPSLGRYTGQVDRVNRVTSPAPAPAPTRPRISSNDRGSISRTDTVPFAASGPPPAPAPIEPTPPPSLEEFLGTDETYKTQKTAIDNAIADYLAQMAQQRNNYEGDYKGQLRDLGTARERGLEDLTDDFAGRGLLRSGLYADADSDLRTDFTRRETDLGADRTKFFGDLETGKTNFTREQQLTQQRAKAEAIARRAAMYGL